MGWMNASPTYQSGSNLDLVHSHRNTHPVREEEERRERRRRKWRGLDDHGRIYTRLFNIIYSDPDSPCSGRFTYASKPCTSECFYLLSTTEKLVSYSAGRRGQLVEETTTVPS